MDAAATLSPGVVDSGALFRLAISHLATGVTVITTRTRRGPSGMTASAVCSLSLDPLMVLVCVGSTLPSCESISDSGRFAINVLGEGQERLAMQFARGSADKFAGVRLKEDCGVPILAEAIAHFTCTVNDRIPGGDHTIFTGLVDSCGYSSDARPLVYFKRSFKSLDNARHQDAWLWPLMDR